MQSMKAGDVTEEDWGHVHRTMEGVLPACCSVRNNIMIECKVDALEDSQVRASEPLRCQVVMSAAGLSVALVTDVVR